MCSGLYAVNSFQSWCSGIGIEFDDETVYIMFLGSVRLSQTLRQQCAAELCVNVTSYAEHGCLKVTVSGANTSRKRSKKLKFGLAVSAALVPRVNNASLGDKVRVVKDEARLVLNGGTPSLLQAAALATVIKRPIHILSLDQVSVRCK